SLDLRSFPTRRSSDLPFGGGGLFQRVRAKQLPDWAAEFDCRSWAQFFLKWIVAHPAVTCVIPATNNPRHLEDNMQAGVGRLPDAKMRQRMVQFVSGLQELPSLPPIGTDSRNGEPWLIDLDGD